MDLFWIMDVLYERLWIPILKMNSGLYLTLVVWFRGSVHVDILYVGETEAGWIACMLGGPVPTTKLHRCAEGGMGEIEGWRTPSNEPTHHERRTILAACRHRSDTDVSRLLRFAIPCLWSWNISYEFLKYCWYRTFAFTHVHVERSVLLQRAAFVYPRTYENIVMKSINYKL